MCNLITSPAAHFAGNALLDKHCFSVRREETLSDDPSNPLDKKNARGFMLPTKSVAGKNI